MVAAGPPAPVADPSPATVTTPPLGLGLPNLVVGSDLRLPGGLFVRLNQDGHFIFTANEGTCVVVGDWTVVTREVRFAPTSSALPSTASNCPESAIGPGSWLQRMTTAGGEFSFTTNPIPGGVGNLVLRMNDNDELIPVAAVQL